jgi:uncharacterized membrane protein YhdT
MSSSNQNQELYHSAKWQNDMIKTQSTKMRDIYSTDQQKVRYLSVDIQNYVFWNFVLWILYYVISLVAIYFVFYGKNALYFTRWFKIAIVVLFLLYPMIITSLEILVYGLFTYLYSLITNRPYPKTKQYESPAFSFLDAMPPGTY